MPERLTKEQAANADRHAIDTEDADCLDAAGIETNAMMRDRARILDLIDERDALKSDRDTLAAQVVQHQFTLLEEGIHPILVDGVVAALRRAGGGA